MPTSPQSAFVALNAIEIFDGALLPTTSFDAGAKPKVKYQMVSPSSFLLYLFLVYLFACV
jgi:hypothetical protein